MATPEPAPPEPTKGMTPSEYVDLADRELAAGNHRHAAGLLWKATEATFINLADSRGIDRSDPELIDVAKALEADGSVPKFHYRGGLGAGKLLRDHAELDTLEDYELEFAYETMRGFIIECQGDL